MSHEVSVLQIRQEGTRVLFIKGGKILLDLPWDAALEVSRETYIRARAAEEIAKADAVIMDQAIVQRAGMQFGMTNNRDIQVEAMKEAVHNPLLRRHMPTIKSQEILGAPSVHHA